MILTVQAPGQPTTILTVVFSCPGSAEPSSSSLWCSLLSAEPSPSSLWCSLLRAVLTPPCPPVFGDSENSIILVEFLTVPAVCGPAADCHVECGAHAHHALFVSLVVSGALHVLCT